MKRNKKNYNEMKQIENKTDAEKYNLLDLADEFCTPDQLKHKRI